MILLLILMIILMVIIRTDRVIEARRPDIVVVDKRNAETTIIDIAVPGDLALELTSLWKTSTKVIPIVIGALGASHKTVEDRRQPY